MVILYSNGCPKCNVLKKKLYENNIAYELCDDVEEMRKLGINKIPVLSVDGEILEFKNAVRFANNGGVLA